MPLWPLANRQKRLGKGYSLVWVWVVMAWGLGIIVSGVLGWALEGRMVIGAVWTLRGVLGELEVGNGVGLKG
jgi:hypothetical protein